METNIQFRATSPDGNSFFRLLPGPTPRAGRRAAWPGDERLLAFPLHERRPVRAAHRFPPPRRSGVSKPAHPRAPRCASPNSKAWVPPAASRADAGYVGFECTVRGTPMVGRDLRHPLRPARHAVVHGGHLRVGGAPLAPAAGRTRHGAGASVSFRLDPAGRGAARGLSSPASAPAEYRQVIQEMNRMDAEITRHRSQTARRPSRRRSTRC
ncbi:MAG: hypothetical protein MZV70_75775 [Desulfobacterales bacterium]|nr:hypothetical protein [Desulfobacterales bacterium]